MTARAFQVELWFKGEQLVWGYERMPDLNRKVMARDGTRALRSVLLRVLRQSVDAARRGEPVLGEVEDYNVLPL